MGRSLHLSLLSFLLVACGGSPAAEPSDTSTRDGGAASDGAAAIDAGAAMEVDAARAIDAATIDAATTLCPPAAPFGTEPGDVSADIELLDCDGNTHTLHELCETQVLWLFEYADWCPPCRSFAMSTANAVYDENRAAHPDDFEGWMVISETASFGTPTLATCADVRDRYGVHMPVLIDPTGALQSALGVPANEIHVVLERGARIQWVGHYAGDEVAARIDAAFEP
jgi:hypothetical protein